LGRLLLEGLKGKRRATEFARHLVCCRRLERKGKGEGFSGGGSTSYPKKKEDKRVRRRPLSFSTFRCRREKKKEIGKRKRPGVVTGNRFAYRGLKGKEEEAEVSFSKLSIPKAGGGSTSVGTYSDAFVFCIAGKGDKLCPLAPPSKEKRRRASD